MSPEHVAHPCVFCRKHVAEERWRPFCSERCRLQDLARWADGTYRAAAEPVADDSELATDDLRLD